MSLICLTNLPKKQVEESSVEPTETEDKLLRDETGPSCVTVNSPTSLRKKLERQEGLVLTGSHLRENATLATHRGTAVANALREPPCHTRTSDTALVEVRLPQQTGGTCWFSRPLFSC